MNQKKLKIALLYFAGLCIGPLSLHSQNFDWLRTYGAKQTGEYFYGHCPEKDGGVASLLLHGPDSLNRPKDTLHLDTFQYSQDFKSGQGYPRFLVKHDSNGVLLKSRYIGNFSANYLTIDDSGNYYVAGNILRNQTIVGSDTLDYHSGTLILAKFDKDFNYLWYAQDGGDSASGNYVDLKWTSHHLYFIIRLYHDAQIGPDYYPQPFRFPCIFGELDPNNGAFLWSKLYYMAKIDNGGIYISDIIRLPNSKIYISGGTLLEDCVINGDTINRFSGFVIRADSMGNYEKRYVFKGKTVALKNNFGIPNGIGSIHTDGTHIYCAAGTADDILWKGKWVESDFDRLSQQACVISFDAELNEGFFYRPAAVTEGNFYRPFSSFDINLSGGALYAVGYSSYHLDFDSIVFRDVRDSVKNVSGGAFLFKIDTGGKLVFAVKLHSGTDGRYNNVFNLGLGWGYGWSGWGNNRLFVSAIHNALYIGSGFLDSINYPPHTGYTKGKQDAWLLRIIENKIFPGNISSGPFCAGDTLTIPFTKEGNFDSINYFIAELSDADGSFEQGVRRLGVVRTFKDSSIRAVLPLNEVQSSAEYRIRIRSTWPPVTSNFKDDTLRLLIYSKDKASAGADIGICPGDTAVLAAKGGTNYQWTPSVNVADPTARNTKTWPAVTTRYRLVVSDTSGCSPNDTAYKTIEIRHAKIDLDSRDTVVCVDDTLDLTARFTGVDSSKYRWQWWMNEFGFDNLIEADSGKSSDKLKFIFDLGYDVKLKIMLDNGCKNSRDTVEIKVQMPGPISLTAPAEIVACVGEPLQILPVAIGGVKHQYKYRWEDANSNVLLSENDTLFYAPESNTTIRVSLNDVCMETGDTAYIKIKVKSPLMVSSNLSDTTLCYGQNIFFNAAGNGGDTAGHQFDWWLNGQKIFTGKTLNLRSNLYMPDTGATQKLVLIFNDGCTKKSDSIASDITVRPAIKAAVIKPDTLCFGEKVQASSLISGRLGNYNLEWQNSAGLWLSDADTLPVEHKNKSVFGTQHYMLIAGDGCSMADTTSFTIEFLEPLHLVITTSDSCVRTDGQLSALSSGGKTQNYKVEWFTDGAFLDTGSILNFPLPLKETLYSAVLSDACSENSDFAFQWISPFPAVQLSSSPVSGCELLDVSFRTARINQTRNEYMYLTGSGNSNWIIDSTYSKLYSAGNYLPRVAVRSMTGCTDTFETDTIIAYPTPKAQFHSIPSRPTPNVPVVNFVNQSTGAIKYRWDFGPFGSSELSEPSVSFNKLGTYPVKLVAVSDNGCMDSIQGEVKVYDDFYIHVPGAFTPGNNGLNDVFTPVITSYKSYTLRVYNRWGQLLYKGENQGWDGKYLGSVVPEGKYAYALDIYTQAGTLVQEGGMVIVMKEK